MPRLSFSPVGDTYLLVVAAALVLVGLLVLGPARAKVGGLKRAVLVAIRLAVIALVILAMLRPTLVYTKTTRQSATLIVLADRSRSMSVPDEVGGKSRWEALRRTLANAQDALRRLDDEFELKAYVFDAEVQPANVAGGKIELGGDPAGRQTAIGHALETVLRQEAGKRLLGIVLLSDGAQRAYPPRNLLPQTAAGRLKHLGYPLFAVRLGKSRGAGQAQDVAVKDLLADQRVFVKNDLAVTGQIRADGYVNREIPVQLLFETSPGKMEPVDQENLRVTAAGALLPVQFSYAPQLPGEYKLSLEAVAQPGELVTTNNRLSTFVNVLKGGLNVLYLEGSLRVEQKFIRRALDASADINVDYVRLDAGRPDARPQDLAERFKPGKYEVYLLGDLDSDAFRGNELQDLADTVSRGAGLIMLGGFHSFGPGGYAETPLADVLPVNMSPLERQVPGSEISDDLHEPGPLRMRPTPIGLTHFSLTLAGSRQENLAAWGQLPPLDGANRFRGLKPGALVLAAGDRGAALLVAQVYGEGRVMAFAGDSTWRWWMRGNETAHKRFWRQVVLWLARKDESLEGNVWVKLRQRRFAPGQRVEFGVGAQSPTGEPVEDAAYEAEVVLPDGKRRPVRLVAGETAITGSFRDAQAAGDYTIRVTAKQEGRVLGTARARFLVFEQDLELDNAAADATVLDNLATMTGGQSLTPEELPDLIERLTQDTETLRVQRETTKTLWDTWSLLLLLVGLLGGEWYLRKRWGLV